MKIVQVGVDEKYPDYLQNKIRISNQIALVVSLFVASPFFIISLIFFPPIAYLPAVGAIICLFTLVFNHYKLHGLSRVVIAAVPIFLCSIYGGYINSAGELPIPSMAMLSLSFTLIIFLVFDIREKWYLITLTSFSALALAGMDYINNLFEIELDTTVIKTGFLSTLTIILSLVVGGGSILILAFQNRLAGLKSEQLLLQAKESNEQMLAKEQELKDNINKIEESQEEEKKRQWANEGLKSANKILRENKDLEMLCDNLISFTVKFTKSNQGGIFLLNDEEDDNKYLELMAAYAFDRKKYLKKKIKIGEGLIGQAFLEEKFILLKELPDQYISIRSGLGDANPNTLIIVPLKVEEEILGLIELATFNDYEQHHVDFLHALAENIGATIMNTRNNIRTRKLLEESQQQTEQMRAQEEEMRQNQEEWQATQEELSRQKQESEAELLALKEKLAAYEKSNDGAKEDINR